MVKETTPPRVDEFNLYRFDTPQQITAGYAGEEQVFFDCCDCGQEDAVMHGCMGTELSREGVAVLSNRDGTNARPAYYCEACFHKVLTQGS